MGSRGEEGWLKPVRVSAARVAAELKKRERGWLLVAVIAYEEQSRRGELGRQQGPRVMRELYFERESQ